MIIFGKLKITFSHLCIFSGFQFFIHLGAGEDALTLMRAMS